MVIISNIVILYVKDMVDIIVRNIMTNKCPFCRNIPYITDLRKIYHDELTCKICEEKCNEQYAGPCGHLICKYCVNKIKENNDLNTQRIRFMSSLYTINNVYIYQIPQTLYTCTICNRAFNKCLFSRRQRRKINNYQCKNCVNIM